MEEIKEELAVSDEVQSLDELVDLAFRLDNIERGSRQGPQFLSQASCVSPDAFLPLDSWPSVSSSSLVLSGTEEPLWLGQSMAHPAEEEETDVCAAVYVLQPRGTFPCRMPKGAKKPRLTSEPEDTGEPYLHNLKTHGSNPTPSVLLWA